MLVMIIKNSHVINKYYNDDDDIDDNINGNKVNTNHKVNKIPALLISSVLNTYSIDSIDVIHQ